MVIDGGTMG